MKTPIIQNSRPSAVADEIRVQDMIIRAHLEIHNRLEGVLSSVLNIGKEMERK